MDTIDGEPIISRERAIAIAEADAIPVYGDLSRFNLEVTFRHGAWHVDYHFVPPPRFVTGGGPHYVIHPTDGQIISKRYQQ